MDKRRYGKTLSACLAGVSNQAIITNVTALLFVPFAGLYGFSLARLGLLTAVNFAAQMLASSNLRVNEIARKAGYDSVHTFIRTFRKQFDCTPAEYRARNGGAK